MLKEELNKMRVTPFTVDYGVEGCDGEIVRYVQSFETENELFRFVSRMYAFDDCYFFIVYSIKCGNKRCKYTGWQPCMKFTYVNTRNGKVVWEDYFPEYDH